MIARGALLDSPIASSLRCVKCRSSLRAAGACLICDSPACGTTFPVRDGVPILINEETSLFSAAEIASHVPSPVSRQRKLVRRLVGSLPSISANVRAGANVAELDTLLRASNPAPRVLIIGGGRLGEGLGRIVENPAYDVVESDVYLGPRTNLVSDAHDVPFEDRTFDGVVIQAVLHAVIDPRRAIAEVHRVLKPSGLLYVEVPFAQQNCEGPYDFYRYTHLGLRRLLRDFEELRSGAQGGPGMAMAWAYQYFLYSLASTPRGRMFGHILARLTASWLVLFDRFLIDRPAALDAASGVFFLGRRSEVPLSDRELVRQYRGSVR